jgi:RNA-splicing ligase RtcB
MLFQRIPAGLGSTGAIRLSEAEMDSMLAGGARWAVERGWGADADLERIEEGGQMEARAAVQGFRAGEAPAARRDGHARQRQPLP